MKSREGVNYSLPVSNCSLEWTSCVVARFQNESSHTVEARHCETGLHCYHQTECFRCRTQVGAKKPCNDVDVTKVYSCYRCASTEYCALVNEHTSNRTVMCTAEVEARKCFTYVTNETVIRDCYDEKGAQARVCRDNRNSCEVCTGSFCNSRRTQMYCYQCDLLDYQCHYDQYNAGLVMCTGSPTLTEEIGCYSMIG